MPLVSLQTAGRAMLRCPRCSSETRPRHRLGGMACAGTEPDFAPKPFYLRPPDAKPKPRFHCAGHALTRHDAPLILGKFFPQLFKRPDTTVEPANLRDAPRLSQLHRAAFHRGWSTEEFEQILIQRNALAHRLRIGGSTIGFIISRTAADEAEILSVRSGTETSWPRLFARSAAHPSWTPGRARPENRFPRTCD